MSFGKCAGRTTSFLFPTDDARDRTTKTFAIGDGEGGSCLHGRAAAARLEARVRHGRHVPLLVVVDFSTAFILRRDSKMTVHADYVAL